MTYARRNIIKLTPDDDYGVYIPLCRPPAPPGSGGDPTIALIVRGTWDQVTNLNIEVGPNRAPYVSIYHSSGMYVPADIDPSTRRIRAA